MNKRNGNLWNATKFYFFSFMQITFMITKFNVCILTVTIKI